MKVRRPAEEPVPGQPPDDGPTGDSARQWHRIKEVFLEALDQPPASLPAFLARACGGDTGLRREVESLLASDDAAAGFGETPAAALLSGSLPDAPVAASGPRLAPGARLGAYEITGFVAAGGMGDVYRARHTVLGREVALKTVSAERADESSCRRLLREARHASQLKHPGICTIHEVGESERGPYIVMEYVPGRPLSELVQAGAVTVDGALDYGLQVAAALAHAHGRGIVHRDLKASNVVVDGAGRAIVLDFGLARRLPEMEEGRTREQTVTELGSLAGTLSHMAPEVLLGGEADARSDVWALGVLLYEMVAGRLPFRGRTPYETTGAILGDPIQPLDHNAPMALRLVIERCLLKQPEARYQSAGKVAVALDAIRRRRSWPLLGALLVSVRRRTLIVVGSVVIVGTGVLLGAHAARGQLEALFRPRLSTLALLPLTNDTGEPEQQYYADGMTDALIAQLGAATDIRIIAPGSAARAAANARDATEIAQRLGANALVQGSMRRIDGNVLVDLQLVRPTDGSVLWHDSFQRRDSDVPALQADVVRALVLEVRLSLRSGARERLTTVRSVSPDVYEAYLKGRYEWNRRTPESLQDAIAYFRRAVELDPTYAPAHAALADCYSQLGTVIVGTGSPLEWRPRAAAEAIQALQLDPGSAAAHASLGYVLHYDWKWAAAEREFRRALELNPSNSMAHIWYANLLMSLGRWDEAIAQVYAARELDPFSLIVNTNVAWVLDGAGRPEEAVAAARRAVSLDSTYLQAHWRLAGALQSLGRVDEARAQVDRLIAVTDSGSSSLAFLAGVLVSEGQRDSARAILDRLLQRARTSYVAPYSIAGIYRSLRDDENGVAWMTKALEERSNGIAYIGNDTVGFGRDPRYRALLARVGLPK